MRGRGAEADTPPGRLAGALFLQGAALLSLEIVLARVLAVIMWHHFASLVISLALLGMALGALTVYLTPGLAGRGWGSRSTLALAALGTGFSTGLIFVFFWVLAAFPRLGHLFFGVLHEPFFEPFGARTGPSDINLLLDLAVLFLVVAIPFFAGGAFFTAVFARRSPRAGSLYAANLLGGAAGCLLAVGLLSVVDGLSALALAAVPALGAALLLARAKGARALAALALAAVLLAAGVNSQRPFARLMFVRGSWQPDILHERWNATSRVVVYPLTGRQEEGSWGQSRETADVIPRQLGMVVDDTGYTTITSWPANGDLGFMRHNLIALPYVLRPAADTLIVGPGGGRDILAALAMGARRVQAVEINPLVVEAVDEVFGDFSGRLYSRPPVTTAVADGRSWLARDRRCWDVLQASVVYGRLPPSAGAFTLSEEQLYTLESYREYLDHLRDEGILAVTRFVYEKRMLRLVALSRAVLKERGADSPNAHLFIAAERGLATILLKKTPFTPGEVARLEAWCRKLGFQVLYSPGTPGESVYHRILGEENTPAFRAGFRFDVSPPTDDRPYLYYLLKPADFWRVLVLGGDSEYEDRAILIIRDALFLLVLLAVALAVIPLRGRAGGGGAWIARAGGYFGGIALGFITVEIVLMKQLVLYLGFPTLALTVVLAALLAGAGMGSLVSQGAMTPPSPPVSTGGGRGCCAVAGKPATAARWLVALLGALAVFPGASPPLLGATAASPLAVRVAVALIMVFALGFLMGFPLPAGIRLLGGGREELIPWALSVNGAISVLGAMLALVLALNYGFHKTWLLGMSGYAVALLCLLSLRRGHGAN